MLKEIEYEPFIIYNSYVNLTDFKIFSDFDMANVEDDDFLLNFDRLHK